MICFLNSQEVCVVLCLMAVVAVHAYPAENIESQQPAEQIEPDANNVEAEGDLEGAESRYGGWGRGYGGGWGRGYG